MGNVSIRLWSVGVFLLVAAWPALPAHAQVDLRLEPVPAQATPGTYRVMILSVANHAKQPVRAVSIRMVEGGPAYLYPLAVPPEANAAISVSLPVAAPEQFYVVRALAGEDAKSPALAAATVATQWAPGRISPVDFVDSQPYTQYEDKQARWPGWFLRELFVAVAVACIALSAAIFIRGPARRMVVVGVLAAGCAAGILVWSQRGVPLTQTAVDASPSDDANRPAEATLVVSSLRTIQWRHTSARLIPIYRTLDQMARDDAVIEPRQGISLTLHAGETRIFRVGE
jgi:hypothetical protein